MVARRILFAAAVLGAAIPALAQDSGEFALAQPSPLRATAAYPTRQETGQWLGSNLIGAKVVSASNETIGRVANLLVNDDGAVEAAMIAFGGVFGFGRKEVAVNFKSLNIVRNKTGDAIDHVTLTATKNDLRYAADFKTLTEQRSEARR